MTKSKAATFKGRNRNVAQKPPAPKAKRKKPSGIWMIMFWLKSSRGTNRRMAYHCPRGTPSAKIKAALDIWANRIVAGSAIEHYEFGYRRVRNYSAAELQDMIKRADVAWRKAGDRRDELLGMFRASSMTTLGVAFE